MFEDNSLYSPGQQEAEQHNLISICLEHLDASDPLLRRWLAVAVGRTWDKHEKARWRGARDNAHSKLFELLRDSASEVQKVFTLGCQSPCYCVKIIAKYLQNTMLYNF